MGEQSVPSRDSVTRHQRTAMSRWWVWGGMALVAGSLTGAAQEGPPMALRQALSRLTLGPEVERVEAAGVLGSYARSWPKPVWTGLATALAQPILEVRIAAVFSLGQCPPTPALAALWRTADHDNALEVRQAAAAVRGTLAAADLVKWMTGQARFMKMPSGYTGRIIQGLETRYFQTLLTLAASPIINVRRTMMKWSEGDPWRHAHWLRVVALTAMKDRDASTKRDAAYTLEHGFAPGALEAFYAQWLRHPNPVEREQAIMSLSVNPDSRAEGLLAIRLIREEDLQLRIAVANALGRYEGPASLSLLLLATKDTEALVRTRALKALAKRAEEAALPAWSAAFQEAKGDERWAGMEGLLQTTTLEANEVSRILEREWPALDVPLRQRAMGLIAERFRRPQADQKAYTVWRPWLERGARDPDRHVRRSGLTGLMMTQDPEAFTCVLSLITPDESSASIPSFLNWALPLQPTYLPGLLSALRHPHPAVRHWAAEAAGRINDESIRAMLVPLLQDVSPEVRQTVQRALDRQQFLNQGGDENVQEVFQPRTPEETP